MVSCGRVRRELPHLAKAEAADLARVTETLVEHFRPDRGYVFGSQARGEATWHSDVAPIRGGGYARSLRQRAVEIGASSR